MASFKLAIQKTSRFEGGLSLLHDDNGNWTGGRVNNGILIGTNHGVSAPLLTIFLGRVATKKDMIDLSKETAHSIFEKEYWNVCKCSEIKSQDIAEQLFDMAITSGQTTAIKIMQSSLGLKQSGKMNKETIDKINNV